MDRDHFQLVARAVRQRREELGLTQIEAVALTADAERKISFATWRKVETGVEPPYSRATVRAVCHALGWQPDAFDRLLAGQPPLLVPPTGRSIEDRIAALEAARGLTPRDDDAMSVEQRLARLEALEGLRS